MFCTRCGTRNLETDQVCRACNSPLVRTGEQSRPNPPSGSTHPNYPYSTGSQSAQQPAQPQQPYPGYQGFPVSQPSYANQSPAYQSSASGRAIAAMILSIVSLFTCGPLLSVPGLIMGKMEMNAIREGRAPVAGEAFAKVGFYVGIIVTVLYCAGGLIWALIVGIGVSSGSIQ